MRTYNVAADLKSAADSRSGGSGDPLEQDLLLASRNRGNHIVADEITWEQYILKKCPCRPVERCFSETQCSQVGVFEATWEQYVPDNRPYRPLRGRCRKTYCSQVFRPALSAFPPTTFVIVTNQKMATEITGTLRSITLSEGCLCVSKQLQEMKQFWTAERDTSDHVRNIGKLHDRVNDTAHA